MRNYEERNLALECLRIAHNPNDGSSETVARAESYFAFVTGDNADSAKQKIDAARQFISPSA